MYFGVRRLRGESGLKSCKVYFGVPRAEVVRRKFAEYLRNLKGENERCKWQSGCGQALLYNTGEASAVEDG